MKSYSAVYKDGLIIYVQSSFDLITFSYAKYLCKCGSFENEASPLYPPVHQCKYALIHKVGCAFHGPFFLSIRGLSNIEGL